MWALQCFRECVENWLWIFLNGDIIPFPSFLSPHLFHIRVSSAHALLFTLMLSIYSSTAVVAVMGGKGAKTGANQLWNSFKTSDIPPFEQSCRKRILLPFGNWSNISIFSFMGLKSALEFFHATFIWLICAEVKNNVRIVAYCCFSLGRQEHLVAYGSYRTHWVWSGATRACPSCSVLATVFPHQVRIDCHTDDLCYAGELKRPP